MDVGAFFEVGLLLFMGGATYAGWRASRRWAAGQRPALDLLGRIGGSLAASALRQTQGEASTTAGERALIDDALRRIARRLGPGGLSLVDTRGGGLSLDNEPAREPRP